MATVLEAPPERIAAEPAVCEACSWGGACIPLADLHCLVLNKPYLEGDYGWDIFSFMAEAKRQYRKARECSCTCLDRVQQEATALAPQVDFTKIS